MSATQALFDAWQHAERRVIALRKVIADRTGDDPTRAALEESLRHAIGESTAAQALFVETLTGKRSAEGPIG